MRPDWHNSSHKASLAAGRAAFAHATKRFTRLRPNRLRFTDAARSETDEDSGANQTRDIWAVEQMLAFLAKPDSLQARSNALAAITAARLCLQDLAVEALKPFNPMDARITRAVYVNAELAKYFRGEPCHIGDPAVADVYVNYLRLKFAELRRLAFSNG